MLPIVAVPITAATQDAVYKELHFHYKLDDFSVIVQNGTVEVRSNPFYSGIPEGGEPSLPVFKIRAEVPLGTSWRIDTIHSNDKIIVAEKVSLLEAPYPMIGTSTVLPPRKLYPCVTPYVPINQIEIENQNPSTGNYIFVDICPFVYDSTARTLYFTPDLSVTIRMSESLMI